MNWIGFTPGDCGKKDSFPDERNARKTPDLTENRTNRLFLHYGIDQRLEVNPLIFLLVCLAGLMNR